MEIMERAKEYSKIYKKYLPEEVKIYLPDTQGPFDFAHLIRGDEIFIDIYDDTEFFKFLMEISTCVYIKGTEKLKEIVGEDLKTSYDSGCYYIGKGRIKICEDSTTLLSSEHIEIVLTYTQKFLKYFGGGWIHYCGELNHLFNVILERSNLTEINLGTLHTDRLDREYLFKKINERNKVYIGNIPRKKDETWKDYLRKVFELSEGGNLIFDPSLKED